MELERLRILIEATTGDSATQVGRLNKILEQHAGALKLSEKAAQAAERAEKLHEKGVSQASAAILRAAREQQAATKTRLAAGNAVLASMNRAAAAEAKATINQRALKDAIAKTTAMAQKADTVFAQVDRSLVKSAQVAQGAAKGQKSVGDAFFGGMQKAFFFMSAVDRVHAVMSRLFDAAEEAARVNTAKMYFDDAGKSLEHLREVSRGLISDAKLMKKANLADSMGLSGGVFDDLIRVAQAASAKTGQSFDHMFDSIVVGTARSSRLLLDNLGLIVSIDEANRRLAAEYKKDARYQHMTISQIVDAFDDEAKKIAFVEEVSRKAQPQLAELNRLGMGGASAFDKWNAAVDNLKQSLMTNLLPAIEYLLGKLTSLVDGIAKANRSRNLRDEFGDSIPGLGPISDKAQDPSGMSRTGRTLLQHVPGGGMMTAALESGGKDAAFAKNASQAFSQLLLDIAEKAGPINPEILLAPGTKNALSLFAEQLGANDDELMDLLDRFKLANTALERFTGLVEDARGTGRPDLSTGSAGGGGSAGPDDLSLNRLSPKIWDTLEDFWEGLDKLEMDELDAGIKKLVDKVREQQLAHERTVEEHEKLVQAMRDLEGDIGSGIKAAQRRVAEDDQAREGAAISGINAGATLVSGDTGAVVEMVATAIGAAAGSPGIGAAIGKLLSPFLNSMGGLTDVVMGLFNGFTLLINHAVGPLLATLAPLGPALEDLMAAVGILIGAAIDPFLIILKILIPVVALVVDFVTAFVVALTPIVALLTTLGFALFFFAFTLTDLLLEAFTPFSLGSDGMAVFTQAMKAAGDTMINGAIKFNNVIVDFVRWLGTLLRNDSLKEWGAKLSWDDFDLAAPDEPDPDDPNTDAVNENTRALRDLAREFHNLPSGYKGNSAIYNAANPERPWWMTNRFAGAVGAATNSGIEGGLGGAGPARRWNPYRG